MVTIYIAYPQLQDGREHYRIISIGLSTAQLCPGLDYKNLSSMQYNNNIKSLFIKHCIKYKCSLGHARRNINNNNTTIFVPLVLITDFIDINILPNIHFWCLQGQSISKQDWELSTH